ncbi:hypothetical protein CEXT_546161 [Caerostris extrusa]|uniref:Uncharacterized protein n=1 Tax=Caerostris extrusa TaxID=172846 RepID=A0AAV4RYB9_CAEEX|nr:hypothetical protein CEXT_546161 [Caerostris extrusa]
MSLPPRECIRETRNVPIGVQQKREVTRPPPLKGGIRKVMSGVTTATRASIPKKPETNPVHKSQLSGPMLYYQSRT